MQDALLQFPKIDVEKEFSEVVRSCAGLVLSDVLNGSPDFKNADYVFPQYKVVAELKCLTEDNFDSPQRNKRVDDLWRSWKNAGKVTEESVHDAYWKDMPKALQTQIYQILGRPIVKRIQKANKQIRETKSRLNLDDHRGLLLLVNDGKMSFSPAATIHAAQLALQKDFREIREFVFFTVNLFSAMKGVPVPALYWFHFHLEQARPEVNALVDKLGQAWRRHHSSLLGNVGFASEIPDEAMEAFWFSRYM
jgi:hypothetical protein